MKLSILIKFCLIFHLSRIARCRITTKRNVTATYGNILTLPCRFDGDPIGVYWYKHKATGDLDSNTEIVFTNFWGEKIILDTRYDITDDFSMVIKNVTTEDETTFSCEVALEDGYDGKNYTDVTVIALANPLHPVVLDCEPTEHNGTCLYTLKDSIAEVFHLTCGVDFIRPSVKLSWTASSGPPPITGDPDIRLTSIPGLYNVSLIAQVPRTSVGEMLKCMAEGDAVKGNSSIKIIFGEQELTVAPSTGLSAGGIVGIFFFIIFIIFVLTGLGVRMFYRRHRDSADTEYIEENVPLSEEKALEAEITKMREQILSYTSGSLATKTLTSDKTRICPPTRLSLIGTTGCGKSSFVRSLIYATNGQFIDIEVATGAAAGGVTTDKTHYNITHSVSIQDDRGLKDFDKGNINKIMREIIDKRIHCPIIVLRADAAVREDILKFIYDISNHLQVRFGSRPVLVITHKDKFTSKELDMKKSMWVASDILPERIIFVSNFTEEPEVSNADHQKQRLDFMQLLLKLLEIADNNIIHLLNDSFTKYLGKLQERGKKK